jgi:hypothetical protein
LAAQEDGLMSLARTALAAATLSLAAATLPAVTPVRTETAGGVQWTVPGRWQLGSGSAMRVATYGVPSAKPADAGECAVFFFGAGQGGTIDANVERWGKQFEGAPKPVQTSTTVAGLRVTRAQVAGTYLAPGGPAMQSTGKKTGYRLLGAIVEAPEGNVFFKLTGPAATIAAAEKEFEALVASLRKR